MIIRQLMGKTGQEPHWNGETGIALWGHVPESGFMEDEEVIMQIWNRLIFMGLCICSVYFTGR